LPVSTIEDDVYRGGHHAVEAARLPEHRRWQPSCSDRGMATALGPFLVYGPPRRAPTRSQVRDRRHAGGRDDPPASGRQVPCRRRLLV